MKGFTAGALAAWSVIKTAQAIAVSDTQVGKQARKTILSKLDHDLLLRLEKEVTLELMRRREAKR